MSLWTMLIRELAYRKLGTLMGLLGVAIAVSLLVGMLVSLEIHAARSEAIIRQKQEQTRASMKAMEADVKAAMHHLGYNVYLLPKDQPLGDWYADDYASKTMPESAGEALAKTTDLFDRFLPRLRQKIEWTEKKWTVILVGVGQEQILDTSVCPDTPLVTPIEPGTCAVGYELHQSLNLRPGDTVAVQGTEFRIERCDPERGTKDDITIWMNLQDLQKLTGHPDRINEILAVEHLAVWGRPQELQQRLTKVLPDCQVIEVASETMSRAHARGKVVEEAAAAIERERQRQAMLQTERARIVHLFVPLGVLVCAVWVGIAMFLNVRDRTPEIGVLMAQGFRAATVRQLIFAKAVLQGMVGGAVGFLIGFAGAIVWERAGSLLDSLAITTEVQYLGLSVVISTVACLLGSWLPASLAVRTDPAVVLRDE